MNRRTGDPRGAFRRLERHLTRRRIRAIDPMLRLEVAALALLGAGFVFWQSRIPLHGLIRDAGAPAFLITAAACTAFLAMLAAGLCGARLARALRATPEGPAWLALPVPPGEIERHLAWNALAQMLPLLIAGAGFVASGVGLVPLWWLPLTAVLGGVLVVLGGRAGCWIAVRGLARRSRGAGPAIARVLVTRAGESARTRLPEALWRRGPRWRAIVRKDLRWMRRPTRARRMWPAVVGLVVLSLAVWRLPLQPTDEALTAVYSLHAARFAAFGLALLAAAAFAGWIIELSGSDPFAILRGLPLSLGDVWRARAFWVAAFALVLTAAHGVAGIGIAHAANPVFLIWLLLATWCIGLLGVHYGITLFPNTEIASRLLGLSLGLAVAASVMLPMLGWLLLLTAVLHSMRRLPRWSRIEDL